MTDEDYAAIARSMKMPLLASAPTTSDGLRDYLAEPTQEDVDNVKYLVTQLKKAGYLVIPDIG
jgi:hypothetical protein